MGLNWENYPGNESSGMQYSLCFLSASNKIF